MRGLLLAGLLLPLAAAAHPEGFHQRLTFTLTKTTLTGLLVLDVDSGERCELLRAGADANHDGVLNRPERGALERTLAGFITRTLRLAISSFPIPLTVRDTKLNLHGDQRVGRGGLSVAILLEVKHPYEVSPGMHFEVSAASPDQSPVLVEVLQATVPGAPAEPDVRQELAEGVPLRVRLGVLGDPPR